MSRRTAEANKAIRGAWENERQYVLNGKGTRDWTPEQQQSILEKGRVYDNNGKAFEGHHMKSVAAYPDFQGYAGNIQFLSREEHIAAHGGCTQNPTNGYYDPITKETVKFPEGEYTPCEAIQLSQPIAIDVPSVKLVNEIKEVASKETIERKAQKVEATDKAKSTSVQKTKSSVATKALRLATRSVDFGRRHPGLVRAFKIGGGALVSYGLAKISTGGTHRREKNYAASEAFEPDTKTTSSDTDYDEQSESRDYPEKRKSPVEHKVTGGRQRYGKDKHWVEKADYQRGSNKDNEEGE